MVVPGPTLIHPNPDPPRQMQEEAEGKERLGEPLLT